MLAPGDPRGHHGFWSQLFNVLLCLAQRMPINRVFAAFVIMITVVGIGFATMLLLTLRVL